jgi:hypothetical protein
MWVAIIMGIAMFAAALMTLGLRFWVMRDGGLPDGGTNRPQKACAPLPADEESRDGGGAAGAAQQLGVKAAA